VGAATPGADGAVGPRAQPLAITAKTEMRTKQRIWRLIIVPCTCARYLLNLLNLSNLNDSIQNDVLRRVLELIEVDVLSWVLAVPRHGRQRIHHCLGLRLREGDGVHNDVRAKTPKLLGRLVKFVSVTVKGPGRP
jgi:hypothetical protein